MVRIGFRVLSAISLLTAVCAVEDHLNAAQDGRIKQLQLQEKEAFTHGNYDAAIRFATEALQLTPQSPAVLYDRALAYYRKGDTDSAIKDVNEVIRLKPTFDPAYVDRGMSYFVNGWPDKALSDFNQAIRLGPRDARAYCDRADLEHSLLGHPDKALADYNQAIHLAPNFQRAYVNRGGQFATRHDYARAIADYTRAIRLEPNDLGAYASRAYVYAKQSDRTHALADATTALKLKPKTAWYVWQATDFESRASAYRIMGQQELALRDLRAAVRIAPRHPPVYAHLAWFLATCPDERFRNGVEAVSAAKKACELRHWEHSGSIDTLATAYAELGDFEQARKYEQQSLNDSLLAPKEREEREERLALFRERRPFREDLSATGKP